MTRVCCDCGADVSMRHHLTMRCLSCAALVSRSGAKVVAYRAVSQAVARGDLAKPSTLACVDCGKHARDYDHRDYSRPLDVQPVCRSCNKLRGPADEQKAA